MSKGDDYAWSHPSIAALKAAGITFVCRYESRNESKNLTRVEADQLHAAGIATVTNWEASVGAPKLGRPQGVKDATEGRDQHAADGGPSDRPIYFSADWDVQPGELAVVGEYFKGVASVIGLARTGAYGGYRVIKWLLDNHLITWAWQTYAWSGGQWDPRVHIRQVQNGVTIGGADTDLDQSMVADFGQWPGPTTHQASQEEPMFLARRADGTLMLADGMHARPVSLQGLDGIVTLINEGRIAPVVGIGGNGTAGAAGTVQRGAYFPRDGFTEDAFGALPPAQASVDVAALATALAGQLPDVSEQQVLQALTSDAGQAALVKAANTAEDS